MNNTFIKMCFLPKMHCPAPICSDLSRLFSGCSSVYSVTVFPKQGKMEQVTTDCSSKMIVKIGMGLLPLSQIFLPSFTSYSLELLMLYSYPHASRFQFWQS